MNKKPIPEIRTMAVEKVRALIVNYIHESNLEPGDKIPAERVLSSRIKVSRTTIAKAMAELIENGTLVRKERSGTYVGGLNTYHKHDRPTIAVVMPWLKQDANGSINFDISQTKVPRRFPRQDVMTMRVALGVLGFTQERDCKVVVKSYDWLHTEYENIINGSFREVDGMVVIPEYSPSHSPHYEAMAESGFPLVFADHYYPEAKIDSVSTDNVSAARQAIEYLISKGHRRIAYFTDFVCVVSSTVDREQGYREALENAGIEYDEDIVRSQEIMRNNAWSYELALSHCLNLKDPVTAIFCSTDETLLTAYQSALKLGIEINKTLEIAGFYDEYMPNMMAAPFTRVVQDTYGMGMTAARLVLERISNKAPSEIQRITLPATLMPCAYDTEISNWNEDQASLGNTGAASMIDGISTPGSSTC
ncbi:MAG: GntR family transcriptional regulator [Armatimonadota bacterium]|nr:GntR family transcriptional regulator [bacterium]